MANEPMVTEPPPPYSVEEEGAVVVPPVATPPSRGGTAAVAPQPQPNLTTIRAPTTTSTTAPISTTTSSSANARRVTRTATAPFRIEIPSLLALSSLADPPPPPYPVETSSGSLLRKYYAEKSRYDSCFGMHVETAGSVMATLLLIFGSPFLTEVCSLVIHSRLHIPGEDNRLLWALLAVHTAACFSAMFARLIGKAVLYAPFIIYAWVCSAAGLLIMLKFPGIGLAIVILSVFCLHVATRAYAHTRDKKWLLQAPSSSSILLGRSQQRQQNGGLRSNGR